MRNRLIPLALAAVVAFPAMAQGARFIKVDIVSKSEGFHHHHKASTKEGNGPTEVHMRLPVSLAKSVLEVAGDTEIKINGETKKGIKTDALIKMLEASKPGDLLLEITTNSGDLVKVVVE